MMKLMTCVAIVTDSSCIMAIGDYARMLMDLCSSFFSFSCGFINS